MDDLPLLLDAQYRGTFACPQCAAVQTLQLSPTAPGGRLRVGVHPTTLACQCGAVVSLRCDVRRHPRTSVQLQGTLSNPYTRAPLSTMVITSLSVHGLGFRLIPPCRVRKGANYTVSFHLDDAEQSCIDAVIVIRRLDGPMVGATFYPEDAYNYVLDFYISDYLSQALDAPLCE